MNRRFDRHDASVWNGKEPSQGFRCCGRRGRAASFEELRASRTEGRPSICTHVSTRYGPLRCAEPRVPLTRSPMNLSAGSGRSRAATAAAASVTWRVVVLQVIEADTEAQSMRLKRDKQRLRRRRKSPTRRRRRAETKAAPINFDLSERHVASRLQHESKANRKPLSPDSRRKSKRKFHERKRREYL